jgi:hypothetical protein
VVTFSACDQWRATCAVRLVYIGTVIQKKSNNVNMACLCRVVYRPVPMAILGINRHTRFEKMADCVNRTLGSGSQHSLDVF